MESPERFIRQELGNQFVVKPNSIGPPKQYLGNKVSHVSPTTDSEKLQASVKNVIGKLAREGRGLCPNEHLLLGHPNTARKLILHLSLTHPKLPITNL